MEKSVDVLSLELFWKVILQPVFSWAMKCNKLRVNCIHFYCKKIILTIFSGLTISSDGTSHRSINYNSRHVNLRAETHSTNGMMEIKEQVTRFLGIHSSVDGTSEQAIKDWDAIFTKIIEIYNNSPLGQHSGTLMRLVDIFLKLLGMHSDHCSKEKKDFKLLQKKSAVEQLLGENKVLELSNEELLPWFFEANDEMIKAEIGRAHV